MLLALVVSLAVASLQDKGGAKPPAAIGASDDPDFVKRVNAAVDRADEWLAKRQEPDGGYGSYHFFMGEREFVAGKTALALLARIAAGEAPTVEPIARGFGFLKQHAPKYTYEVGLTLMAFDARDAPVGERQKLDRMSAAELAKYAFPRTLQPGDAEFLQPLVDRLAKERWLEWWSYGGYGTGERASSADASNTQYAVLGLKAASRLGLDFDRRLFSDMFECFLDHQETKGKSVSFVDQRDGPDGKPVAYARKVDAKGFAYTHGVRDGPEICGSRTCIGVACIELALDELLTKAKGNAAAVARKRKHEALAAIDSALAWMQEHWSVTENPTDSENGKAAGGFGGPNGPPNGPGGGGPGGNGGPPNGPGGGGGPNGPPNGPGGGDPPNGGNGGGRGGRGGRGFNPMAGGVPGGGFYYYYLYSLERVGALTARKYVGKHDWYREGADELLKRQLPNGAWPGEMGEDELVNSCFALLFLRRATVRSSITGNEQH
jgi:hypothetical protein